MELLKKCPLCNGAIEEHYLNCIDNTVTKEKFNIVKCKSCSFAYTNPRPSQPEIGKYYESENYISHSNTQKGIVNKAYQIVRNFTISRKYNLIKKYVSRGTLLDIGCGTGEFLNFCSQKNFQAIGVEPGTVARNKAIKNYGLKVHEEPFIETISDTTIDVITMWHVLEHVHDLNMRVAQLHRILKMDGLVVIAVPNYTSYDAKYYKEYWAAYDLPRHLYHFSPQTIKQLFDKHGFKLIDTRAMVFDSFYVSLLSEKYKTGNTNYFSALFRGALSNLKALIANNSSFSSQIYLFKKNNSVNNT